MRRILSLLRRVALARKGRERTQRNRFAGSKHSGTHGESGRAFLSRSESVPNAGARRSSRPDGYLVYLAEAAGRERSHQNLPQQGAWMLKQARKGKKLGTTAEDIGGPPELTNQHFFF